MLDPAELTIEGPATLAAIVRLLHSGDERDVRLGLDTLEIADHPDLVARLQLLAADERIGVRTDVLDRLVRMRSSMAAAIAREGVDHDSPVIRTASIRALGAAGEPSDLSAIVECLDDDDAEVVVAAVSAVCTIGNHSERRHVARAIRDTCPHSLTGSAHPRGTNAGRLRVRSFDRPGPAPPDAGCAGARSRERRGLPPSAGLTIKNFFSSPSLGI